MYITKVNNMIWETATLKGQRLRPSLPVSAEKLDVQPLGKKALAINGHASRFTRKT